MFLMILATICIVLFYLLSKRNATYWKDRNVVQKDPLPFVGNIAEVVSGECSLGMAVKKIYDTLDESVPYFGFYVFQSPYLVLKSPEILKQVLIKDFTSFPNRPTYSNEKIDPVSANVLFSLKNDVWRELRRKLTPIFTSGKIKMMLPLMKEITDELETHLEVVDGGEIDVRDLAKRYSVDTISSCAFGINSNSIRDRDSEIFSKVIQLLDMKKIARVVAAFAYFFCPIIVKIFRLRFADGDASHYLVDVFKNVSEERRRMKVKRHDLIDCLHSIQEEEQENDIFKFDDLKMSAQAVVFFNAGSEPAASLISFLLYELALNPDIQKRLRAEILENIDSNGSLSNETLSGMKYLDMVTAETLRKYPLTQILFRQAEQDYTFEDTGLKIEKGTPILIPQLAIHLDPKYYPNPEKFDPERFRSENQENKLHFLPFGEGPRKCIGNRFAIMQIKIGVAMLLKNYKVTPSKNTEIPLKLHPRSFLTMPKSGSIHLNVQRVTS